MRHCLVLNELTQIEKEIRAQEAQLARQHAAYDQLRELRRERERLQADLDANKNQVLRVFRRSRGDLTVRGAASALGVGRATLNRWLQRRPDVT
jgi:hypothetical protein